MNEQFLVIAGFIVSVLGFLGTYYQILGWRMIWIILLIIIVYYIYQFFNKQKKELERLKEELKKQKEELNRNKHLTLRIKTVQIILKKFKEYNLDEQIERDVGLDIGEDFIVNSFLDIYPNIMDKELEERLKYWSEYDSEAGLAESIDTSDIKLSDNELSGEIKLINSFQRYKKINEPKPICLYMEGYIEGVVRKLSGKNVLVREEECGAVTAKKICKFKISKKPPENKEQENNKS